MERLLQDDGGAIPQYRVGNRIRRIVKRTLSLLVFGSKFVTARFKQSKEIWSRAISSEVLFWDKWFASGGLDGPEDYRRRLDPDLEVFEPVRSAIRSADCKILDVGAGPLTVLGKKWHGQTLDITAVDALGLEYDQLLQKYNISPIIRTEALDAERLTARFAQNTFDISNAQNCLDHSYDPVKAIEQLLEVTKIGGVVLLVHGLNEGAAEAYRGLHQWNLRKVGGDFVISSPGRSTVNMSKRLANRADFNLAIRQSDACLVVSIYKKG